MSTVKENVTVTLKAKRAFFDCHSETAKAVFLAGSFNDWNPEATPMKSNKLGNWTASLALAPGRHEYKLVVDGEWCCEPGCQYKSPCPHCILNAFGTMNRVLEV